MGQTSARPLLTRSSSVKTDSGIVAIRMLQANSSKKEMVDISRKLKESRVQENQVLIYNPETKSWCRTMNPPRIVKSKTGLKTDRRAFGH